MRSGGFSLNSGRVRLSLLALLLSLLAVLVGVLWDPGPAADEGDEGLGTYESPAARRLGPSIPESREIRRVTGEVPAGGAMQQLLTAEGCSPQEAYRLIQEIRPIYDLARIMPGRRYELQLGADNELRRFVYEIDDLRRLVVRVEDGAYVGVVEERPVDVVPATLAGHIQDSFWNAVLGQGESPQLVMNIFELMQWDIDFTAIQPGDAFRVLYEKRYAEGEFLGYGDIHALEFVHGGRSFYAFRFKDPRSGKVRYFDEQGRSVRKAFLKVPFKANYRISSGFSYSRLHPVTGRRQPHYGVDYAAPPGTPVLASAAGRVVFAGWSGGSGKMVKIRHPNGFYTYYLHLSKILVRAGQSVAQGQVIGRVGSTGLATGPHLDYRIQDPRGRYLNPKKYVALPSEEGVAPAVRPAFEAERDRLLERLEAIPMTAPRPSSATVAG
ncbi:MAG: M23 family metallopeptidase [Acidobacteriota bacterium]